MERFGGKTVIVTGSGSGIGAATARRFAREGAFVVLNGRTREKLDRVAADLDAERTLVQPGDVSDQASAEALISAAIARFGRLDVLVNNAGVNERKRPELYAPDEWHRIIETNLSGAFFAAQAAFPEMKKGGGGKIINIGSMMSIFGASFVGPYAASKGGLVQLTKALATAWAGDGIQVNAILPGWIDTDLTAAAKKQIEGLNERVLARTPAGRWGNPGDFAGIAVFLASAASDFVTGAAIPVDGGYASQG
jgi:2-dehydro-3-deoxy-D-gluconate 5-dehydrogenase